MAAAMVGKAFLSGFLQDLINRLDPHEKIWDFIKRQNSSCRKLLWKLKAALISMSRVQDDAEEKQITDPLVKKWLNELKDAVYDADDLLDQIAYEAYHSNLEDDDSHSFLYPAKSSFSSLDLYEEEPKFEKKLAEIVERFGELKEEKCILGLREEGTRHRPSLQLERRTTSLLDESEICGRVDDKEAIIRLLLSQNTTSGNGLGVIPIVGMGGIGKTTLAQLVYGDHRVMKQFEPRAWVCVSEETDAFKVIGNVLKEFAPGVLGVDSMTPNLLHNELRKILMGKRFFLVLDDVWNVSLENWEVLQKALKFGSQGSMIIVTTRLDDVASMVCTIPAYALQVLRDEQCWSLFMRYAFKDEKSSAYPELEVIGKEIVSRCKGLPLAAKALGCLLKTKKDVAEWERILKSDLWNLEHGIGILPALRLSYHYLPSNLKRCFAYCAIYPKDYKIAKEKLIRLWMADGLLACQEGNQSMEEVGDMCFDALLSRSFFQLSSASSSHFVMHDLINDLAKSVAGDFCFRFEGDGPSMLPTKTHHLSYAPHKYDASKRFQGIYQNKSLRTFLPIHLSAWKDDRSIDEEVIYQLLSKFKCLRVLSLIGYVSITHLPESIANLKHLRYLDLSRTRITRIPDVVGTLWNLQTLLLEGCRDLKKVPESIANLKHLGYLDLSRTSIMRLPDAVGTMWNLQTLLLEGCIDLEEVPGSIVCLKFLQYLNLAGTKIKQLPIHLKNLTNLCALEIGGTKLQEMPPLLGNLTRLQKLSDFFVGKQTSSSIKELKELAKLRGGIRIWSLQNVENAQDALQSNMKGKKHLKRLELSWEGDDDYLQWNREVLKGLENNDDYSQRDREVLEGLETNSSLEYLSIVGYRGTNFADWVGNSSFSKLVSLTLRRCTYCSEMPPLGQLESLKELYVVGFDSIVSIDSTFYGSCLMTTNKPFKSLEVLRFGEMSEWMIWQQEEGAFPCLRELQLSQCPNLKGALPRQLPSLTKLVIEECDQLIDPFPRAPAMAELSLMDRSRGIKYDRSESLRLKLYKLNSLDQILGEIQQMGVVSADLDKVMVIGDSNLGSVSENNDSFCPWKAALKNLTCIHSLEIKNCPNLVTFPKGGFLTPNLMRLYLWELTNLKSLPERMHSLLPSLVDLDLRRCPQVESFPEGGLPSKLESLSITCCNKLIAGRMQWNLRALPSLRALEIGEYEDVMESFPEAKLLPSTLTYLKIWGFDNLKSLDYKELQHLARLQHLWISGCDKLEKVLFEGLPSTITSLYVGRMKNIKSLESKGLQHLTCLRELRIDNCSELESVTEQALPSSLRELRISSCYKLQYLPKEGLPSSLEYLYLSSCPLLEEKCEWEGEYWPKISDVPRIFIHHRYLKRGTTEQKEVS